MFMSNEHNNAKANEDMEYIQLKVTIILHGKMKKIVSIINL